MPARTIPLATNETYHVFNRGNASMPIVKSQYDHHRFIKTFLYYQNNNPPMRFSQVNNLAISKRAKLLKKLKKQRNFLIEIVAYCLMPNHFHFILKQLKDKGILNFIRVFTNSYSRYFNTKNKRKGGLFEGRFKAVRVETNNQLLHLSRYVHLNPYSSFLVKDFKSLLEYPFSSLPEYISLSGNNICNKESVLDQFSNREEYKKFVLDQADYQRSLAQIKHQILEG